MTETLKERCTYWDKCYRKDPSHKKQFLHPGDVTPTSSTAQNIHLDLSGKKIVFTGTLAGSTRKVAQARAKELGCIVSAVVSSKTDIVVVGDEAGSGALYAKELGIKILTGDEWETIMGNTKRTSGDAAQPSTSTSDTSVSDTAPKKAKKRRKIHDVSESEDEDEPAKPALQRHCSERLSSKPKDDDTKPPPAKKANLGAGGATSMAAPADRPKCRYWSKCYHKDPLHLKNFRHPRKCGTKSVAGEKDEEEPMDVDVDVKCTPLHVMEDSQTAQVMGGLHGNTAYTVKRTGDHYTCTCVAWKQQKAAVNVRTCKHLRTHLGDDFEDQRTGFDPEIHPNPSRALKHKNVSVLLAHKWTEGVNPQNWWLSEKLDGVRAYWDGQRFYSRLGNEFLPPSWFIKGLPRDMELDGELFGGRGQFQSTVSIVKTPESSRWKDIKYCVFDAPSLRNEPFEARMKALNKYFNSHEVPYAYTLEQELCRGKDHMFAELKRVEGLGGEGVMIREPRSKYVGSRSHTLLKLKTFHDAEARVIGFEKGKGRNASVVGALVCVMACGKQFKVGSGLSDKDRRNPPKKGSIITYRFQELTNSGSPRFPSYVGVRIDLDEPSDAVLPPKPTDD